MTEQEKKGIDEIEEEYELLQDYSDDDISEIARELIEEKAYNEVESCIKYFLLTHKKKKIK